jgi:hypothetical protein
MYEFSPGAADVRIFGGGWGWGPAFFSAFACARGPVRLVLKLRAGAARRAARPSALGGRINGLKGQKGEEAGMSLGVVAVCAPCSSLPTSAGGWCW